MTAAEEVGGSGPPDDAVARLDVLVVDDDPDARRALERAVGGFGHTTRGAASAEEAMRLVAERRPDVVVSDWHLPGMTGADLCRLVRAVPPGQETVPYIYFVLVTGDAEHHLELRGMEAGADDFQRKPLDLVELEAHLVSAARVVGLHRRISDQQAQLRRESRRLYVASRTDPLTGVQNRRALDEELAQLFARATRYDHRYAIGICDVDHFKAYNDAFGHLAGDQALCRIADEVRATVRASDEVFRYGGEEFVVLFPEQTLEQAAFAMERVRRAVERLAMPAPKPGTVLTVSAGVAEVDPERDRGPAEWLGRADAALYGAKADGRNRVTTMHSS